MDKRQRIAITRLRSLLCTQIFHPTGNLPPGAGFRGMQTVAVSNYVGTTATVERRKHMAEEQPTGDTNGDSDDSVLTISPETVCFIAQKAREFDVKEEGDEDADDGSNPADDGERAVLEELPDDTVVEELTEFIKALSEDEQIDLVTLTWLGRGDYTSEDWATVRQEAASEHNATTARYLLGIPLLSDYLEEGLSLFGRSCDEFDT